MMKNYLRHNIFLPKLAVLFLIVISNTSLAATPQRNRLSPGDRALLEDLSRRSFRYFWEQADPRTGLVLDRARTEVSPHDETHRNVASIAATGFGLTAICIAAEHSWISASEARDRVRATLRFFAERATHEHGWFYHWLDAVTGERRWNSEISSIDTALLLGGVLRDRKSTRLNSSHVALPR